MAQKSSTTVYALAGASAGMKTRTPEIIRIDGAKLGEQMVTLPNGNRHAREGRWMGEGYYTSAKACATKEREFALDNVRRAELDLACALAVVAECDKVLAEPEG